MNDTFQFIERARLLLDNGRISEALQQLKNALQQDPDNDDALALFARCQYMQKDYEAGIATLQRAIAIDPENGYYFYLLAFGYYRKHMNQPALDTLAQAITLNPYFAEAYGLMAYVYLDEKDFKKSLSKANEGLALDPENITCLNVRSIALNKMKFTDEAIQTMEYALAQDPDNELTHSTVGWNYLEKGRHKIAVNHFREALRIDPNYHNAKDGLKESLKSKIAPYRWLLQYSFWINNKAKKVRWVVPVALYLIVRIAATAFNQSKATENIAFTIVGIYLVFVITSWLINPIANLFLLFHKDGKHALDTTEKNTAITVVSSLILGCLLIVAAMLLPKGHDALFLSLIIASIAFCTMALPLGKLQYPLSFTAYGTQNKISMVLVALALLTILLAFLYPPAAIATGIIFLVIFAINNWVSVFR
jgi:tetratricopeptide (TPR) repeat protein